MLRWRGFLRLLLGLALAVFVASGMAFAPPDFAGDVLDEVGVLDAGQRARLEARIEALRSDAGIWAVVYVSASLQGASIEEVAVDTFQHWKLGQKGQDNGLLVVVAPRERKMRIEVGYGLEGAITDALSKRVIDEIYKPAFRDNRFADGLIAGFDRLALAVSPGAPVAAVAEPAPADLRLDVDWGNFFAHWFGVWLANLGLVAILWAVQRRRVASGRLSRHDAAAGRRDALVVFAFLGGIFGLFVAVFSVAFPDDPEILPGLLGFNGIFDLVFFIPLLLRGRRSGGSASRDQDRSRWGASDSSSSWDSSSSDSSSSSSSDGGSSGGGGASGDY